MAAAEKDLRTAHDAISTLRTEHEMREMEHENDFNALREKLQSAKRALEVEKKKFGKVIEERDGEWELRLQREIKDAVVKHEARIQVRERYFFLVSTYI